MITPTIHLNGTSRETLLAQATNATEALTDAIEAMRAMAPNGRDYYPQGDNAIRAAIQEHSARIVKLNEVHAEVMAIAEAIVDAP